MKRCLITGASGFLGWNLCQVAQKAFEVHALAHRHIFDIPGVSVVLADITDREACAETFKQVAPDAVIHAAAIADPNVCQRDPELSRSVNYESSVVLARLCEDAGIPMVFVSTDLVFDGTQGNYSESDDVNPVSVYAEHKVAAEEALRRMHEQAIICRVPVMFGDPGPASKSFIQPILSSLEAGREVTLYTDEYRTPVGGLSAARGIVAMLEHGVPGIYHLGGTTRISRFDFGKQLVAVYGKSPDEILSLMSLLVGVRQKDSVQIAPRPADVSLNSNKAYALGYNPLNIAVELQQVIEACRFSFSHNAITLR